MKSKFTTPILFVIMIVLIVAIVLLCKMIYNDLFAETSSQSTYKLHEIITEEKEQNTNIEFVPGNLSDNIQSTSNSNTMNSDTNTDSGSKNSRYFYNQLNDNQQTLYNGLNENKEKLKQGNYTCLDRDLAASPEEKDKIQRETFFADYFLMSTNAITIDGELINIDGLGNRVSALIFGPKNVLIIAGINKIAENLDVALSRAKNTAGVTNAIRFNCNTPCTKTGKCHSCTSNDTVCCQYVHTKFSKIKNRIKVILVEENLGF